LEIICPDQHCISDPVRSCIKYHQRSVHSRLYLLTSHLEMGLIIEIARFDYHPN
jgi:hypothetical protein